MIKEKTLDKATIDTYHEWVQQGVRNELNSVGLGPGKLPFRFAIFMVIVGFGCFLVGLLLVALRMRHVYLWDWDAQFLGPFFFIMFICCISAATYLIILAKRRSNKYRSQLYFKPVGDWGVHAVHKSELARVEEFKHDLKSGTTPHKSIKPRSEAYSQSSKDVRGRGDDGRDNRGYDRSPLDANKPFRPDDKRRGPPPDGRRGPPPDGRRGPPPDGRRGPPPDGRRGPPPDGRRGPPPDGRRGPPPDGRRGPPPDGRRGPPPDGRRGPPPDDRIAAPPDYRRSPHPDEKREAPPSYGEVPTRRSPPPNRGRGSPPPNGRRGSPPPNGRRGSPPPNGRRGSPPPNGRRGSPPPNRHRGSPPPNGRRGPPSEYSDRPSDSEGYSGPPNGQRRPPPRFERMEMENEVPRRPRGAPRFGDVVVIPDEERRNRHISDRSRESESEI